MRPDDSNPVVSGAWQLIDSWIVLIAMMDWVR